ncbi:MAG: phosphotransferase [Novosphingobium sp.]|nr:phosphotransferase [Novosphingobium sp.]
MAAEQAENVIGEWIASNMGGELVALERQGRWRPAWYGTVRTSEGEREIYIRGERSTSGSGFNLKREYAIHRLCEQGGIKVPQLYGFIEDLPAIVMERVRGRHDLRHAASEEDRESVRRQLAREMAKMHKLDTAPFIAAGFHCPQSPIETTLAFYSHAMNSPRPANPVPNPRLAFLEHWVSRNTPPARTEPKFTACDAGQFMYDGGELTAMMDLELGMLADPMQDLAILRRRTTYEPMGDIPGLFRMYEEEAGKPLDLDIIYFHTVASATAAVTSTMKMVAAFRDKPSSDVNLVEMHNWFHNSTKQGFEGVAEVKGYTVPKVSLGEPRRSFAHDPLLAAKTMTEGLSSDSPFDAYRRNTLLQNFAYQERIAAYGQHVADCYLDDAGQILGTRPHDVEQADRLMEAYVNQAGPEEDERLFTVLCADILRRCLMLAIEGSTYYKGLTEPVQPLE